MCANKNAMNEWRCKSRIFISEVKPSSVLSVCLSVCLYV